jgi:hypothetical protein
VERLIRARAGAVAVALHHRFVEVVELLDLEPAGSNVVDGEPDRGDEAPEHPLRATFGPVG